MLEPIPEREEWQELSLKLDNSRSNLVARSESNALTLGTVIEFINANYAYNSSLFESNVTETRKIYTERQKKFQQRLKI